MTEDTSYSSREVSKDFVDQFGSDTQGALFGLDRIRIRGTLRHLYCADVMEAYLNACRVLIKDFSNFTQGITKDVKNSVIALAEKTQRPLIHLPSSRISKEKEARMICERDSISQGLIGIFSCVESCMSYNVRGDRQSKEIHLVLGERRCTHFYFYFIHHLFGFMHLRLQSWFPFTINICLNGREWLSRQMDQAGIGYQKKENCFTWIEDLAKAQKLMDQQLATDWSKCLGDILDEVHPRHTTICEPINQSYYWSASDTEFATDLLFKDAETLTKLYPQFIHHGIKTFNSPDVMRFLGRRVPATTGRVNGKFKGEIISDIKHRTEGVRIKHSLDGNTIKLYDKQGSVLRVETTILKPKGFRIYRRAENDPEGELKWRPLRRGLADLPRRAEVSQAANNRYLAALASTQTTDSLKDQVGQLSKPITRKGRRHRALNLWAPKDRVLLEMVSGGEYMINGFRNRDLRARLYSKSGNKEEDRRRSSAVTRQLALLRAHGLIKKVSRTHRYLLTDKGRKKVTAMLSAYDADVQQLTKLAA
jgi:hypothetical protein